MNPYGRPPRYNVAFQRGIVRVYTQRGRMQAASLLGVRHDTLYKIVRRAAKTRTRSEAQAHRYRLLHAAYLRTPKRCLACAAPIVPATKSAWSYLSKRKFCSLPCSNRHRWRTSRLRPCHGCHALAILSATGHCDPCALAA